MEKGVMDRKSAVCHLIFSGALALIHELVGPLYQGLDGVLRADSSDAHRNCGLDKSSVADRISIFHQEAEALGNDLDLRGIRDRVDAQKFLAAPPAHQVVAPGAAAEAGGNIFQHHVPGVVAVGVVDMAEIVDIRKENGKIAAKAMVLLKAVGEEALQIAAVGQCGQLVVHGNIGQPLDHIVLKYGGGILGKDLHRSSDLISLTNREDIHTDGNSVAIPMADQHLILPLLAICQSGKEGTAKHAQWPSFHVNVVQTAVLTAFPHNFIRSIARNLLGGMVPKLDLAILIYEVDSILKLIDNIQIKLS